MSLWNLTDKAQKELSLIQAKLRSQRSIIEKEKGVIEQKGDTYVYNRASNALASYKAKIEKAEADYKAAVAKYEAEIEKNEKIMYDEKHKSTPVIIRAEIEIANLEKQKEQLLRTNNIQTEPTQLPLTQATEEIDDSEMMKAFRQEMPEKPLTFITNNFSYCSRSEAKEINKGMQGLIPAGTNYDSSIYGPVATLKRPVKCVKKV
jgi:hypothetical protein